MTRCNTQCNIMTTTLSKIIVTPCMFCNNTTYILVFILKVYYRIDSTIQGIMYTFRFFIIIGLEKFMAPTFITQCHRECLVNKM